MSIVEKEVIKEFSDKVREALDYRVSEVILFGSYATDEYVPGSDVDIAIILEKVRDSDEEKIWTLAEEFSSEYNVEFSPKIYQKEAFEKKLQDGFSFYERINEEGLKV